MIDKRSYQANRGNSKPTISARFSIATTLVCIQSCILASVVPRPRHRPSRSADNNHFPLPSQLVSLFRQASTYFHLIQRIHQSRDVPFHQISTHFDMSHPPTHLHNHDDRPKLVVFHHLHYHHQQNLSVSYSPKHNSNTSHPSIHLAPPNKPHPKLHFDFKQR